MEQKTILQLTALGTFSFALGIISTLTIQAIVGTPVDSSSSLTSSEIASSTVTDSSQMTGPWQGFSSEVDVQASDDSMDWDGLTPAIIATLEADYPGYDIDEVHTLGEEVFVFIELDFLLANESPIDTDLFLFFNEEGIVTREIIFQATDDYSQTVVDFLSEDYVADITNDPLPYRDGFIFTMETIVAVDQEGIVSTVDGFLSFVVGSSGVLKVEGLYYFDATTEAIHIIEQFDKEGLDRYFSYNELQSAGTRYLISRNYYYQDNFQTHYPFDIFNERVQSSIVFDYASYDPLNNRVVLIERFGLMTDRVYVDLYAAYTRTVQGQNVGIEDEKLALDMYVYLTQQSYDALDPWFTTVNMDLDPVSELMDDFVSVVDASQVTNGYQLRFSLLFDLGNVQLDHTYMWNDVTNINELPQGYVMYDLINERLFVLTYGFGIIEEDGLFYADSTLDMYTYDGTLLYTYDPEGIFEIYDVVENEYNQFIIVGRTVALTIVDGLERLASMGAKIILLDETFQTLDTIHFDSSKGVDLYNIWIEDDHVVIDVKVIGKTYEGLLANYANVSANDRLLITIALVA